MIKSVNVSLPRPIWNPLSYEGTLFSSRAPLRLANHPQQRDKRHYEYLIKNLEASPDSKHNWMNHIFLLLVFKRKMWFISLKHSGLFKLAATYMKYKVHTFLSSELPLNYEHFGCVETLSLVSGKMDYNNLYYIYSDTLSIAMQIF